MNDGLLKCPKCGEVFASEYWDDGYIDHVWNFSANAETLVLESAEWIICEITTSGNRMRNSRSIKSRLKCFQTWSKSKELSDEVVKGVKKVLRQVENDEKAIQYAVDRMTRSQRRTLYQKVTQDAYLSGE